MLQLIKKNDTFLNYLGKRLKVKDMTHLDNRKQLKVSDFTQYQNHGAYGGTVTYSNGSMIGFETHFNSNNPYVRLFYNCNGRDYDYRVIWASIPSNLGKGEILYFICPVSGKKCRKLFFIDGMYVHRQAYAGQLYEQQADSKKWRGLTAIVPREEAAIKKLSVDTCLKRTSMGQSFRSIPGQE